MTKQQARVVVRIREMILHGELMTGEKISELALASALGVSRTPIRQALPMLAEEGILVASDSGGFEPRAFSVPEILDAIDIRGALEGLSARMITEHGASRGLCKSLTNCLECGDRIFSKRHLVEADEALYSETNGLFHSLIVEGSGSNVIAETIQRVSIIPFVGAKAVAFDKGNLERMYDILSFAHRQHHSIVQAIEEGESARVEALMKEHVYAQKESINLREDLPDTESVPNSVDESLYLIKDGRKPKNPSR
jgi:GntR family transcriptional regulator, vanillate catabolism transcriptional regulator